jgi:hypothetical protein
MIRIPGQVRTPLIGLVRTDVTNLAIVEKLNSMVLGEVRRQEIAHQAYPERMSAAMSKQILWRPHAPVSVNGARRWRKREPDPVHARLIPRISWPILFREPKAHSLQNEAVSSSRAEALVDTERRSRWAQQMGRAGAARTPAGVDATF